MVSILTMTKSLFTRKTNPPLKYVPPPTSAPPIDPSSSLQLANEKFYQTLTSALPNAVLGTLSAALTSLAYPSIKTTKSVLMGTILRIGDVEGRPEEAAEILVKTSKCTALARPKGWKKFAKRGVSDEDEDGGIGMDVDGEGEGEAKVAYAQLTMRTEYFVDRTEHEDADEEDAEEVTSRKNKGKNKSKDAMDVDADNDEDQAESQPKDENTEKVEKEQLVRGFKYGSTYVPCPDGQFPKLPTKKGIDICGFFPSKNVRHPSPVSSSIPSQTKCQIISTTWLIPRLVPPRPPNGRGPIRLGKPYLRSAASGAVLYRPGDGSKGGHGYR